MALYTQLAVLDSLDDDPIPSIYTYPDYGTYYTVDIANGYLRIISPQSRSVSHDAFHPHPIDVVKDYSLEAYFRCNSTVWHVHTSYALWTPPPSQWLYGIEFYCRSYSPYVEIIFHMAGTPLGAKYLQYSSGYNQWFRCTYEKVGSTLNTYVNGGLIGSVAYDDSEHPNIGPEWKPRWAYYASGGSGTTYGQVHDIKAVGYAYTLTYDGNNESSGSPPVDSTTYMSLDDITVLGQSTLLRDDYVFRGWNTQADGLGTTYREGDTINISDETTLYALWQLNPLLVTTAVIRLETNSAVISSDDSAFSYAKDLSAEYAYYTYLQDAISDATNILVYQESNNTIHDKYVLVDTVNHKMVIYFKASIVSSSNQIFYVCCHSSFNEPNLDSVFTGVTYPFLNYYGCNEFSDGSTIHDYASGYDGTKSGDAELGNPGIIGNGVFFNTTGTGSFNCGNVTEFDSQTNVTISCVLKYKTGLYRSIYFWIKYQDSYHYVAARINDEHTTDGIEFIVRCAPGAPTPGYTGQVASQYSFVDGQTYHLTFVFEGDYPTTSDRLRIYIDGVKNSVFINQQFSALTTYGTLVGDALMGYVLTQVDIFPNIVDEITVQVGDLLPEDYIADRSEMSIHPDIFWVVFSLSIPYFTNVEQVGQTLYVKLEWDTAIPGDSYVVERSVNDPSFSSPVEVYAGIDKSYTDGVPFYNVLFYYRVKSVMSSSYLESGWSDVGSLACYITGAADIRSYRSWITAIGYVYSPFKCKEAYLPYLARMLGYNLKYEDFLVASYDVAKKRIQIKELPKLYRLKGVNRSFSYIFEVLEGTIGTTDLDPELAWVRLYDASWNFIPDPRDYTVWIPINSYPDDPDPDNPGFDYITDYLIDPVKGPNYVSDSRLRLTIDPVTMDDLDLSNIIDRLDEVKPYHLIFDFTYTPDVVSELYEEFFFGEWPDLYHDDLSSYHDKSLLPDYFHSRAGGSDTLAVAKKDVSLSSTSAIGEWVSIIPT